MKLMIYTQYMENYSDDLTRPYWKAKGGMEYFYQLGDIVNTAALGDTVMKLAGKLGRFTPYTQEYVIDWSVEEDDYLTEFERQQLEYYGEIFHPAEEVTL